MITAVTSILRKELNKSEPINVLSFLYDGAIAKDISELNNLYASNLSYSNRQFNDEVFYKLPPNINQIPLDIVFDMLLFHNEQSEQGQKAQETSKILHIPCIRMEHIYPKVKETIANQRNLVFPTNFIKEGYKIRDDINNIAVIPYSADVSIEPKKENRNIDILIYGNFLQQDYHILQQIQSLDFKIEIYGNNPGITKTLSFKELTDKLHKTKIFYNLSTSNGLCSVGTKAMGCGCAILSSNTRTAQNFYPKETVFMKEVGSISKETDKLLDGDKWLANYPYVFSGHMVVCYLYKD